MKTSAQIAQEIATAQRELADIERSLPVIYDRGDATEQQDAEVSLVACQNRVKRLQARLEVAQQEEAAAAEQARKQANENAQAEAAAAHADVVDQLRARRLQLVRTLTAEMDETDPLLWEAQKLQNEYTEAWLRNNPEQRRDPFGWPQLPSLALDDLTDREQHAADLLGVLHASRHRLPGSLNDLQIAAQGQAAQAFRAMNPQPQVEPNPNPQLTTAEAADLISSEIRARVFANFQDNIGEAR